MDIAKESAKEVKSYLKQEKAAGYQYVVFEAAANAVSKEQLHPTKTLQEAQEYIHGRSTYEGQYAFQRIDTVLQSLEQKKEQSQGMGL